MKSKHESEVTDRLARQEAAATSGLGSQGVLPRNQGWGGGVLSSAAGTIQAIQGPLRVAARAQQGGLTWLFSFLPPSNFLPEHSSDQIRQNPMGKKAWKNGVCKGQPPTTQSRREGGNRSGRITGAKPVGERGRGNRHGIAF